jgi:hypothetical protein
VARSDDLAQSIGRYLKKSEQVIGGCRAAPRGSSTRTALMAGAGAAAGYIISTVFAEGSVAAAFGGGIGALAGVAISSLVARLLMGRRIGIPAAVVTLALTPRRLLIFRQSWFANRVAELIREIPVDAVTSITVGAARWISPHPVTIGLADETSLALEAAKVEEPALLAEAFGKTTGR